MHQSENLLAQYGVDSYTRGKRAIAWLLMTKTVKTKGI